MRIVGSPHHADGLVIDDMRTQTFTMKVEKQSAVPFRQGAREAPHDEPEAPYLASPDGPRCARSVSRCSA